MRTLPSHESPLLQQKQAVVRQALYNAAIDLFARNGFDETTVEEVAREAGISRRTFFRYFESKDDLLAYSVLLHTASLTEVIKACPYSDSLFEIIRKTTLASVERLIAEEVRTRQVISISERSASARQAYLSRMPDMESALTNAFASRLPSTQGFDVRPHLLSAMVVTIINASIKAWVWGKEKSLSVAAENVLHGFRSILCNESSTFSPLVTGAKESIPAATKVGKRPKPAKVR